MTLKLILEANGHRQVLSLDALRPSKFEKIDGPVVFVFPFDVQNLPLILIDLHNRTRADERRHSIVAHPHESVSAVSQIHLLNQSDRNLAPDIRQL